MGNVTQEIRQVALIANSLLPLHFLIHGLLISIFQHAKDREITKEKGYRH